MNRDAFEAHIRSTFLKCTDRDILERSQNYPEDYLDLYVHFEWLGWKAAMRCTNK
jgi:hypothetical protein